MAKDILVREQEFLKMNEELDRKTKSFIEKVNPTLRNSTAQSSRQSPKKTTLSVTTKLQSPTNNNNQQQQQDDSTRTTGIYGGKKLPIKNLQTIKKSNTIPRQYRDVLTTRKPIKDKNKLNIDSDIYGNIKIPTTKNTIASMVTQLPSEISDSIKTPPTITPKYPLKLQDNNENKNTEKLTYKNAKLSKQSESISPNKTINNNNNNKTPPVQQSPKKQHIKNNNIDYIKSLNTETNEILQETFRNKKFSYSISSENLADSIFEYDTKCTNKSKSNSETARSENLNTIESNKTGRTSITSSTWKSNGTNKGDCTTATTATTTTTATAATTTTTAGIKKNLSPNGLIKYLKTKVQILQEELETNTNLLIKRDKDLEKSYEHQKKLEKQRDQAISKNNILTEQIEQLEEKCNNSEKSFKDNEIQLKKSIREFDNIKRELKLLQQTNINLEKRLYRSNEELEKSKSNLNQYQCSEREIKESQRIEKESIYKQIKQLKKQRLELISAYKKQLYLIDNLKRQTVCMEQAKMIGFGEKEFTKVLEWNTKN